MKKLLCLLLALCSIFACSLPALAVPAGEARAVIGADLSEDQILTVYGQFGLTRGSVPELTVTNAEERDYLEGLVSEDIIGTHSISCVYIRLLEEGEGLSVSTHNISWCTEDMYRSALLTAGIYDAEVKVGAPFSVSGTAALTGIYKAYEDLTGAPLPEEAKAAAADELIITAELADEISEDDAVAIVSELKLMLDEIAGMSDEELRSEISGIAGNYGYALDGQQIAQLIRLCRQLQGLSIDDIQEKVAQLTTTLNTVSQYASQASTFGQKLVQFIQNIFSLFAGLRSQASAQVGQKTSRTEAYAVSVAP